MVIMATQRTRAWTGRLKPASRRWARLGIGNLGRCQNGWRRGAGNGGGNFGRSAEGGAIQVGHQREHGAEAHDSDAYPDPGDQGIDEDLDDGAAGVGVLALVDGVEVGLEGGVVGDDRSRLLAGGVKALLRSELIELLAVLVDV